MGNATMWRDRLPQKLSGLHVLAVLAVFFGSVFAVNGLFIYRALSTYTGEVAVEPYRKGLAYNQRIAAAERQKELGWVDATTIARDGSIAVTIKDAQGAKIDHLVLAGSIGRPATDKQDQTLQFVADGAGGFVAHAAVLPPGGWILTVRAKREATDADVVYQSRRRVWLKP